LASLRVPLGRLSSSKILPAVIREHRPNESSLHTIEIRNSFSPSMPVCIGKFFLIKWYIPVPYFFILIGTYNQCCGSETIFFGSVSRFPLEFWIRIRGGRFLDFLDFQPVATGSRCKMLF
jgi:hypothetical protein